jgi:sugar lactone lactonase YvrE
MNWQTVVTEPSALGESPFWHPDEKMLYWVDIDARKINRCNVFIGTTESWPMPSEPGCIAPARGSDGSAGLVIALRDGIYRARQWGGPLVLLAPATHDTATTRFNDGKADPLGRFWAGTLFEPRTAAAAQLFSLDARPGAAGTLEPQAGQATVANGLAFSPDTRTLYWADTTSHTVRAWDWDARANTLSRQRLFKQWAGKPAGWQARAASASDYGGRPDGAAVDAQGNYYCAMYEGGRLVKLSPAGQVLAEFSVPARCPTMPCFGDDDLRTLYLTTARQGRPDAELKAWPQSGCVFSMRVEVPGLPVNFFRD